VNINTASLEELDALSGVGPATAQKIIDYRTANGPFKAVDDIKNVSGIGDAKFAAMKDKITV
jgi:competence protein ComEA